MAAEEKRGSLSNIQRVLILASIALLVVAGLSLRRTIGPAYFAATGKPLHLAFWETVHAAPAPVLPKFSVNASVSQATLSAGSTQAISFSATSNKSISAYLEVWISTSKNKQVWKSNTDDTVQFIANQKLSKAFSYTLPGTLAKGQYTLGVIINSADTNTDYFVNENFARFEVM